MKMSSEGTSLHPLKEAMKRVGKKLQTLETQFEKLDSAMENLTQKFEFHRKTLESQAVQDEMWTAVLEIKFTSLELNVFYSYITETLHYLHSQVLEKLPDLKRGLPTLATVLKRKNNNKHIKIAWETVLEALGLQEEDVKAFCTFFIAHSSKAEYYSANLRKTYIPDTTLIITNIVKNQVLQTSLLHAVQVIEKKKTEKS
ncbi:single-pass membrane and coiled-coil domain-containing protein 1 isoform X1 [Antechinus flavipes]|uniref:single-pass membrane and coiled-coil domain-containing protein 1 isoform X1 n=2 Tax=Antechinus flavipes TaxID=38775 RepID=UPI002235D2B3|nr:single-pass membrane and coiled-coil domain-containing protein 1 isoform X1 [Antechinus flavipes]